MNFRIADTFTDSLSKLTGDEQKAVKTTAFDLQINAAQPGMSFHKLDKAKDKNFWSVRVNSDIRLIVHKTSDSLMLCYVDHHDKAYQWAERRKLETHPTTGAAQLVEIRERVEEIKVQRYLEVHEPAPAALPAKSAKLPLFANRPDDELLGYGVPSEWLADVKLADEDTLLVLAGHLPSEAAEALLELAVGGTPKVAQPKTGVDPFEHPDAQRRFRVMKDIDELERALAYPWEKWTTFLHPGQRQWVERDYRGPARVSGSAGTGKTIVALHRAVFLARSRPESRVLLTTFSPTLANALGNKLRRLIGNEPRLGERIDVHALDTIAVRLYESHVGPLKLADDAAIRAAVVQSAASATGKLGVGFLSSEWADVVDAWQVSSWDEYRDVRRLGRKTRLSEAQRRSAWQVFESTRAQLSTNGLMTKAGMYAGIAARLVETNRRPFDFVVVDEAQDVSPMQLRFLAALGAGGPDALFFAGDLGQRIFQQPFSWKALGVDVRGRSRTLTVNYRTSHQIRSQADRLLGPEVSDVDGNTDTRRGTVSVFNGPTPEITTYRTDGEEAAGVAAWLNARIAEGYAPHEIGIFVRSDAQTARALAAAVASGVAHQVLDEAVDTVSGHVAVGTMHLAKGLEFRAVAVVAVDDEVIPLQARISDVGDEADLKEIYDTERHLLYVACTRARDRLIITSVEPASEFLEDLSA